MNATNAKVVYRGISDSFIVTVCLADVELLPAPVNGVYRAYVAAASMWLLALSIGHPIRGGIDVGLAIDIDDDEIYGPVLDNAYRLSRAWPVVHGLASMGRWHRRSRRGASRCFDATQTEL